MDVCSERGGTEGGQMSELWSKQAKLLLECIEKQIKIISSK
jgi:hypothetical protein